MLQDYNAILVEEANRLDGELYERSMHLSPWIDLIDTGAFPDGVGDVVSTMIWERTIPSSTPVWKNMMGADGNSGADTVLPNTVTVATAKTLREYRLQHTAIESDNFNVNDLRTAVIAEEQLGAIRDNLSMNTDFLWTTRARTEYDRLSNHVALKASGSHVQSASGGSADTTQSDTYLSNSNLKKFRQRMIRMKAGKRPFDLIDGAPIFGLVCDSEVSESLKEEVAVAEALKATSRASELLSPLGVEKAYKNFFHIIDDVLPRYTFASGSYTEVPAYVADTEDKASGKFGARLIENTAYEDAPYTRSYILHQDVMKLLYPNVVKGSNGTSFDPVMYRGDWKWLNVQSLNSSDAASYNPDGTIGRFRGVFAAATKAIMPEFGFTFIHKRPGY